MPCIHLTQRIASPLVSQSLVLEGPRALFLGGWLLEDVFPPNLPASEEPREQGTALNEGPQDRATLFPQDIELPPVAFPSFPLAALGRALAKEDAWQCRMWG